MKPRKILAAFAATLCAALFSCSDASDSGGTGIVLNLPGGARAAKTDNIARYDIELSGAAGTQKKSAAPGETVEFGDLETGGYKVSAFAFGKDGNELGSGSAEATVEEGKTTEVPLKMQWKTAPVKPLGTKEAPYDVGDIVFSDGTAVPYESGMTLTAEQKAAAVAVIFYKGTDCSNDGATRTLGLGLFNSAAGTNSGTYSWCSVEYEKVREKFEGIVCTPSLNDVPNSAAEATFTGDKDGSDNWEYICSVDENAAETAATNYPAFDYVNKYAETANLSGTSYSQGWYMPSVAELCYVYRKVEMLNSALKALGGVKLDCVGDVYESVYWPSTQAEDPSNPQTSWYVRFKDGYLVQNEYSNKWNSQLVCAIREF